MADPDQNTSAYNMHHMGQQLSHVYSYASLIPCVLCKRAYPYLQL